MTQNLPDPTSRKALEAAAFTVATAYEDLASVQRDLRDLERWIVSLSKKLRPGEAWDDPMADDRK